MKRHLSCLMPLVLIALSLECCSQPPANKTEQPSASKAEENYKKRKQEFPADFPLPKYPSATIELANFDSKGRPSQTILLTTKDSPDKVFGYYSEQLKQSGWKIEAVYKTTGCLIISSARNGDASKITITETRGGQTGISLSTNKQ